MSEERYFTPQEIAEIKLNCLEISTACSSEDGFQDKITSDKLMEISKKLYEWVLEEIKP